MMKSLNIIRGVILLLLTLGISTINAQNDSISGVKLINFYISKSQIKKADSVLQLQIKRFTDNNQTDSLYQFPLYIGKIQAAKNKPKLAIDKAEKYLKTLENKYNIKTLYKAYLNIYDLYLELGNDQKCLEASKKALEYAEKLNNLSKKEIGEINYIIGSDYYALYDLANAAGYFKASANAYEKSKTSTKDALADAYNGVAVSMWTLRKLDSAKIYFDKAIIAAKKSELEAYKKLYYVAAFEFNLALVYDDKGKINDAISIKNKIIKDFQKIINESNDTELVLKAKQLQASSLSNLAAFYNDIGLYTKAYSMLKYAYDKKKQVYDPKSPRLATSLNQIGLSEINLREYDKSLKTLKEGLDHLEKSSNEYISIEADNLYLQAKAYDAKDDTLNAFEYYRKSEALYKKAYPNNFSRDYIILLRDYSDFLARNNEKKKALDIAKKIYSYVENNGKEDNFILFKEIANISKIYNLNKDYENSLLWAKKGHKILDSNLKKSTSAIDSLKVEFYRPDFLLLESEAEYKISKSHTDSSLIEISKKLDKAANILELRKKTIFDQKDILELLSQYNAISSFSKRVHYDLYTLTKNQEYLNKFIEIHESSVYNKIRTRFNIKKNIKFANIPEKILEREKALKSAMAISLNSEVHISEFLKSEKNWDDFTDTLKQQYPAYYKMRYASIKEPLKAIHKTIPNNTSIVRYLFIEHSLYALVITSKSTVVVEIDEFNLEAHIISLSNDLFNVDKIAEKLKFLYDKLWQPIAEKITTNNVTIIPDGMLFNLSFESLTPSRINSFEELATNSLLAKHSISYNYSLLLLNNTSKPIGYQKDFIAFAPEFNNKMKQDYSIGITDSLSLDKTYLNLLPQPFSVDLAKEYSRLFGGHYFINQNASKQIFKNEANEHKIIHIGTHAESNNVSPELSRLIFAKNSPDEDNSLYTYEIYNENLNSNLAILTACETGKPTYQAGEGMISLAHAFNYAGSESILTSLWKIDEKSSSEIIEFFYQNIKKGLPKDEALQKAKLKYIEKAEGRTIAPQYWAGLVLIGDTSPIDLQSSLGIIWSFIIGLLIIIAAYFILKKKKAKKDN